MAQVSMTVRMDASLKSSFDALCSQFGMSANTAMNVFARAVVQRGKIPLRYVGTRRSLPLMARRLSKNFVLWRSPVGSLR